MSERDELAQELDGVIYDFEKGNGFDDVCLRTIKRVRDALSAQPQGEPVAIYDGDTSHLPELQDQEMAKNWRWMRKDFKRGDKLYTAPPSGIAAGMEMAEICRKSKLFAQFLDQNFWHAHHVDIVWRMDGKDIIEEGDWLKNLWYAIRAAIPQAGEFVAVRRATLENWSRYGNIAEIWFEINGVLAAATGKESEHE